MIAPDDWARVRELFHHALDLPEEARAAFVLERSENAAILEEVSSLLREHPHAERFLSGAPEMPGTTTCRSARLRAGDRLGSFEIQALIGSGGMGEVYRARDVRLDRAVAIKVLSPDLDHDPGARKRFEHEARAISKLAHPHISTLHDVGSAMVDDQMAPYLVMELVDGGTLAARLQRGALPVDQAIAIAIEIAEALVAAHQVGVVHCDLKPGNIMLTRSGAKLLDFGLACLRPERGLVVPSDSDIDDRPAAGEEVIGTLPYMAPERLKGGAADARGDLFAFGAVVYEMVTGIRAFDADSRVELVAALLEHHPPPLAARSPLAPAELDRLVAACLAKDPDERWQTARDLLRELKWIRDRREIPDARAGDRRWTAWAGVALAASIGAAVLALLVVLFIGRSAPIAPRVSFSVYPPAGTKFPRGTAEMAISPDGSRLVFVARSLDDTRHLWLRRFDSTESRRIDGSEGAAYPFWSPDGRAIAFFAPGKLKRVAVEGGLPQIICDLTLGGRGGTWNRSGTILFSTYGSTLQRVADSGGVATPATTLDPSRHDVMHAWPLFLPDGRRFLFVAQGTDARQTALFEGSLDAATTRRVTVVESNVGLSGGHMLSLSKGSLTAHAYDSERAQVHGEPIVIANQIAYDTPMRSGGAFSAAPGVVAYRDASPDSRLIWFARTGNELGSFPVRADYHHPSLSPDEKQIAIEKTDPATGRHTVWALDLSRGTTSRLVFDPLGSHGPLWSPDGHRLVFSSNRLGGVDLYQLNADGSGSDQMLISSKERTSYEATDWSSDGRFVLCQVFRQGNYDLGILPASPGQALQPFLATAANELQGQFSPDMQWIAFTSDESGSPEVYIRRFPSANDKWQVSTRGGAQPRWRRDGKELFYLAPDGRLMAADVTPAASRLETDTPRELFNTGITGSFVGRRNQYVVTGSAQRFLVNLSAEDENSAPIRIVMNWTSVPGR